MKEERAMSLGGMADFVSDGLDTQPNPEKRKRADNLFGRIFNFFA